MRVIFMGTPDFAVPALDSIVKAGFEVVGVFTNPDKKRGRKQEICFSEVKTCALKFDLPVYQPTTLKSDEVKALIRSLRPDVIVVAAYGKILPKEIIDCPPLGCINIHASLLPKYRGAAPIQWAVLNGDRETGISIMQMDEGLDTGDIIRMEHMEIGLYDTSESMFQKLSDLGAEMIVDVLKASESGRLPTFPQSGEGSAYASMISKDMGKIDWNRSASEIHNLVRGLYSWPIAYTEYNGKTLKIYKSAPSALSGEVGEVVSLSPLTVACGEGALEIRELQIEGKKRMDDQSFLMGHPMKLGEKPFT